MTNPREVGYSTPLMGNHRVGLMIKEALEAGSAVSICEIDGLRTLLRSDNLDELLNQINSLDCCMLMLRHYAGGTEHFKLYRT